MRPTQHALRPEVGVVDHERHSDAVERMVRQILRVLGEELGRRGHVALKLQIREDAG